MHRTYERGTKVRLSFSGGPHAPVNMADSTEVNVSKKKKKPQEMARLLRCTALYFVRQVLRDFHTIRHVLQERVARQ